MSLLKYEKTEELWLFFFNWWKKLTNMDIINNIKDLEECVLFEFPFNSEQIEVFNYCTLYTKYYFYVEQLKANNNLDLCACQVQIKHVLEIEFNM